MIMRGKCTWSKAGWILLIIGGLNWGLVGIGMLVDTDLNIVNLIFGRMMAIEALIYVLVGIAAVLSVWGCPCKTCKAPSGMGGM